MYLFGLLVNDPHRVADALAPARALLRAPAGSGKEGWGLGYYDASGEVLLNRRPRHEGGDIDFYELSAAVRSNALVAHKRIATVGELREENTHPFRMRTWLFAHSGTLRGFGDYRARIDAELPAHFGRLRPGDTDSERLFHLFMAYMGEKGPRVDDPNVRVAGQVEAMRRAVARVDALASSVGAGDAGPMSIVVTNGRTLLGVTRGLPMMVLSHQEAAAPTNHGTALRAVLLVSAPAAAIATIGGAHLVPDGSIVAVDRNFSYAVHPLGSQAI
ncbi:MAG TPA: class II glutamine amidotransferase [Myxococcota bacterium]|jgi:glutamine amidotransferase|nr:class II glutamine amidotransferase [Myxococcota bacterium]